MSQSDIRVRNPKKMSDSSNNSNKDSSESNDRDNSRIVAKEDGVVSTIIQYCANRWIDYKYLIKSKPVQTKAITSALISILGEILNCALIARITKRRIRLNPRRIAVFGFYGLFITGPILHWWYGLLERICVHLDIVGHYKTAVKLFVDRAIFGPPFVALTVAFIQTLQHLSWSKSYDLIKDSYMSVLTLNQKFWVPAQALNFGVIPVDFQLLYVNIASILWNILLSRATM